VTISAAPTLKEKVYEVLENPPEKSGFARNYNYFMVFLILLNVTVVILETVTWIHVDFFWAFAIIDLVSVVIFTIEYILRLWVCTLNPAYAHPLTGRLRYLVTPFAIVDLLSILPFYLPFLIPVDLRFLRILRLFRILRILKLGRYSDAVTTFSNIISRKKEELLVALSLLFIALIMVSSIMYYAEHEAQPELFSSIPASMWWALVTLATVGYGDVYPVTLLGKMMSGVAIIIGVCIFALPTAIFAAGFVEEIEKDKEHYCPHCGKRVHKDSLRVHRHPREHEIHGGHEPAEGHAPAGEHEHAGTHEVHREHAYAEGLEATEEHELSKEHEKPPV
jgi:voltage-gated potassium channel